MTNMTFGIALKEKPFTEGLRRSEIMDLYDMLGGEEVYPIELEARMQECSAMGFITVDAARELDFDYESSGLHDFIAAVLDDMTQESEDSIYHFEGVNEGVNIWMSR